MHFHRYTISILLDDPVNPKRQLLTSWFRVTQLKWAKKFKFLKLLETPFYDTIAIYIFLTDTAHCLKVVNPKHHHLTIWWTNI